MASSELAFTGTPEGEPVIVTIYPPSGEALAIQKLTLAESAEYGEEPLQLLEGLRYEYELSNPEYRLMEENGVGVVRQSTNPHLAHCGSLVTGLNTGRLVLLALDKENNVIGSAALEVRPRKLGHRDHYREMLEDITNVCVDLAMEIRAPTNLKSTPSPGTSSRTVHQRFSFLKALITSRVFRDALHRISTHPHKLWESDELMINVRRGFRANAKTMREVAKASRRVAVPIGHRLSAVLPTVPEKIPTYKGSQTDDTRENQFVKFVLENFLSFLRKMQHKLDELAADRSRYGLRRSEADARLQSQIATLENDLLHTLNADVYRGLSKLNILPLGSPVLQRKGGYREVFQAWLKFDMAARLVWHGGDDVYGAGQRNIAVLYEYWVFFKLLKIVAEYFQFASPLSDTLVEETEDGFGIKLKSGEQLAFDAIYNTGDRRLRVQFGYNRTFAGNAHHCMEGSWTERMRPDYTLSLWPCETGRGEEDLLSAEDAERQNLIVHVHFDAKYRIDNLQQIFGQDKIPPDSDSSQAVLKYKRDDLLKMHAYRDAIRRTHGAYVLYPGDSQKNWEEYREILPGLGAFPLRPGSDGTALRRFIEDIVQHVCDRASQREQNAFHTYRIHKEHQPRSIFSSYPELDQQTGERRMPPADTGVLVASCFSAAYFDWAIESGLFAVVINEQAAALHLAPEIYVAQYVLFYGPGLFPKTAFFKVSRDGPRVLRGESLQNLGCPDIQTNAIYLVFSIEKSSILSANEWEIDPGTQPKVMPLDEVVYKYMRV